MNPIEISLSPDPFTIKKRVGILDNIRRTLNNLIKPEQKPLPSHKNFSGSVYSRQTLTLPHPPGSHSRLHTSDRKSVLADGGHNDSMSPSHMLMTERLILPGTISGLNSYQQHSDIISSTETPKIIRNQQIQLDMSTGGKGELLPRQDRQKTHAFCAIPLKLDTFCDFCNQPIWGLGLGPVCQRCADCHMTCHWLCKDKVHIKCELSPPAVRALETDDDDDFDHTPSGSVEEIPNSCNVNHINLLSSNLESESLSPGYSPIDRAVSCEPSGDNKSSSKPPTAASSQPNLSKSTSHNISATQYDRATFIGDARQENGRIITLTGLVVNGLPSADGRRRQATAENNLTPPVTSTLRPGSQFSLFSPIDDSPSTSNEGKPSTPASQSNTLYYTAIGSPILDSSLNGALEKVEEDLVPPPVVPSTKTNRVSLRQSILRKPLEQNNKVRRHTSMIAAFSYDISSLDHADIAQRGISIRQLSPTRESSAVNGGSKSVSSSPTSELPVVMSSVMQATQTAALSGHQVGLDGLNFAKVAIGPRGVLPWKPLELAHRIDIFNGNVFGLMARMAFRLPSGDCEGQIRVHINLIRPVRMVLSSRPTSIFDVVGSGTGNSTPDSDNVYSDDVIDTKTFDFRHHATDEEINEEQPKIAYNGVHLRRKPSSLPVKVTSFRLPRGSSKVLHVRLSTTAQQVISALLDRFNISDNPQKFALYEHTINSDQEVSVRKLFDNESPLGLILRWTCGQPKINLGSANLENLRENFNGVLTVKRIVLQENETGDIEWSCFSLAELRNFLDILNKEEMDYRCRIEMKYQFRKREILRLLALRAKTAERRNANTKTTAETIASSEVGDDGEKTATNRVATSNQALPSDPLVPDAGVYHVSPVASDTGVDEYGEMSLAVANDIVDNGAEIAAASFSILSVDPARLTKAQQRQQQKDKKRLEKSENGKKKKKKRPDWLKRLK